MKKSEKDLMEIRGAFEDFERKLAANVEHAVAHHGWIQTLSVIADVARIRKSLHDLHLKMFPVPPQEINEDWSEEEAASYGF